MNKPNLLDDWCHDWFGVWRDDRFPDYPYVEDCVGVPDKEPDYDRVIKYLKGGKTVAVFGAKGNCLLCDEMLPIGYKSDGKLLWPLDLVHYLEKHGVWLPKRFLNHFRQNNFNVPEFDEEDVDLPWPVGRKLS